MEELSVVGLSQRKESNVHLTSDLSPLRPTDDSEPRPSYTGYPFALVLRLRVLQIVCGISALVMGSVAFIEERRESNLGLGIPAGAATVIAAAASIHTWRGRGRGARAPGRCPGLRSLGPAPLAALWAAACACHAALLVQSTRTIAGPYLRPPSSEPDATPTPDIFSASHDLVVLAGVQIALTISTLGCVVWLAHIEWVAA